MSKTPRLSPWSWYQAGAIVCLPAYSYLRPLQTQTDCRHDAFTMQICTSWVLICPLITGTSPYTHRLFPKTFWLSKLPTAALITIVPGAYDRTLHQMFEVLTTRYYDLVFFKAVPLSIFNVLQACLFKTPAFCTINVLPMFSLSERRASTTN